MLVSNVMRWPAHAQNSNLFLFAVNTTTICDSGLELDRIERIVTHSGLKLEHTLHFTDFN